jgi:excisionase family DNA binding protein
MKGNALVLDDLPVLLTVDEAATVLRISRGLAYELTRKWLRNAGREGLPVIRLGRVLRVPRAQLERIVRGELPLAIEQAHTPTSSPKPARRQSRSAQAQQLRLLDPEA